MGQNGHALAATDPWSRQSRKAGHGRPGKRHCTPFSKDDGDADGQAAAIQDESNLLSCDRISQQGQIHAIKGKKINGDDQSPPDR